MIRLDRTVPFVDQVFSFVQGETSAETCIQTLHFYEQKWHVEHIAPQLDTYVEDDERKTKGPEKYSHIVGLKDKAGMWKKYVVEQYQGFLSETHLVLDTVSYSDRYDIILSNQYSFQSTARAWGEMYSVWANQIAWLGRNDWTYLDFYGKLGSQIDNFSDWAEAVYNILLFKARQEA